MKIKNAKIMIVSLMLLFSLNIFAEDKVIEENTEVNEIVVEDIINVNGDAFGGNSTFAINKEPLELVEEYKYSQKEKKWFNTDYDGKKNNIKEFIAKGYKSRLQHILVDWNRTIDPAKTELYGISYERYFSRAKYIDLSGQAGFMYHDDKGFNDNTFQLNAGVKVTWKKFPWSKYLDTKLSVTEGLSYVKDIPYLEIENLVHNGKPTSKLLNYLEFEFKVNIGDIIRIKPLEDTYMGVGVSHRSGAFGIFNGVSGGSNYIMYTISKEF